MHFDPKAAYIVMWNCTRIPPEAMQNPMEILFWSKSLYKNNFNKAALGLPGQTENEKMEKVNEIFCSDAIWILRPKPKPNIRNFMKNIQKWLWLSKKSKFKRGNRYFIMKQCKNPWNV